jgi:hypothetical protein
MRLPIKIGLAQSAEKSARFSRTWSATDRLFRLCQWVAFLAVLKYAADKSHSRLLALVEVLLEFALSWLLWVMIEAKYEIRVYGVNDASRLHREVFFLCSTLFLAVTFTTIRLAVTHLIRIFVLATHL